jgi:hypothetical protein
MLYISYVTNQYYMKRQERVLIVLSGDEKKLLEGHSRKTGLSMSAFMRTLIVKYINQ